MPREVFVAGQVLTAAELNVVSDQSVMVFAGTAARGSAIPSPTEGMVTYLQDADELQVYTTDWGGVGGGTILQVVSTAKTDTFSTASGSLVDVTGLSATITPASASNKVFLQATVFHSHSNPANNYVITIRDGADAYVINADSPSARIPSMWAGGITTTNSMIPSTYQALLSPATTSALTYKISARVSAGTMQINRSSVDTDNSSFGRGVSTITLMEVAG